MDAEKKPSVIVEKSVTPKPEKESLNKDLVLPKDEVKVSPFRARKSKSKKKAKRKKPTPQPT